MDKLPLNRQQKMRFHDDMQAFENPAGYQQVSRFDKSATANFGWGNCSYKKVGMGDLMQLRTERKRTTVQREKSASRPPYNTRSRGAWTCATYELRST